MKKEERILLAIQKGYKYDPLTGAIYNSYGKEVSLYKSNRYIVISVKLDKKTFNVLGHHFAWYCVHREVVDQIDHINRIKTDNRIANLRKCSAIENSWNLSNIKGYYWSEREKKYKAQIIFSGKKIHLGVFSCPQEANSAYLAAKEKLHMVGNISESIENHEKLKKADPKGYYFNKKRNKFQASITVNCKDIYLGSFTNENEASKAYQDAKLIYLNKQ